MKLHILSDLHLGMQGLPHPQTDADLVILAGDIARPAAAIDWAKGFGKPVLFVAGNHEFYGSSLSATRQALRDLSAGSNVTVLDDEAAAVGGVRFLGSTLWTDYGLETQPDRQAAARAEAMRFMYDFSRIKTDDSAEAPLFTPEESARQFLRHSRWLAERLAEPFGGPTVVVTHHAPSKRSIHPRFADSLINGGFVSDADWLIGDHGPALWVHGHTHDSFDYRVGTTRVVCNPRGYVKNGVLENAAFDPGFVVEV